MSQKVIIRIHIQRHIQRKPSQDSSQFSEAIYSKFKRRKRICFQLPSLVRCLNAHSEERILYMLYWVILLIICCIAHFWSVSILNLQRTRSKQINKLKSKQPLLSKVSDDGWSSMVENQKGEYEADSFHG